jgi:hypothetical protein
VTPTVPHLLDHLVYATPTLAATLDWIEAQCGIRPLPGGTHHAWRTRNAILPLSSSTYLEVIGPDPDAPGEAASIFQLAALPSPRLVTWAAKGAELERLVAHAGERGIALGQVGRGRRQRPDGSYLSWELTDPFSPRAGGLLPFFIDWGMSPHPGGAAPARVALVDFRAAHPDPAPLRLDLLVLGIDLEVASGPIPALRATLSTPRGSVILT